MKKEASGKKGKLWLWIVIAVVLIAAIVAGIIFLPGLLGGKGDINDGTPALYWNVDREANTDRDTGLSIREPAEDGNYYVRFAHDGEQVEIPVADKKLVNYIDSLDLMGLTLDENGYVIDVKPVADIASVIGESLYVQSVNGDTVVANSSIMMNGRKVTIQVTENTGVYNVSGKGEFVGEALKASELNPMDTISIYGTLVPEDSEEEPVVTHVYVLNKPAESEIYFRADQFYDSSNKVTTREPDENGAYTIKWYCNGETVELKCKDKDMVTTIDSSDKHWCHWGLEFDEEGYIIDILDSFLASRTLMQCERYDITEISDDGSYVATSLIKNNGAFVQGVVGADCPIYDISSTAKSEGQDNRKVDSLQLGDRVCIWTDTMGNPVHIYVTRRQAECDAYWVVTRSYSSTTLQTTRTPNENGYYEIELLKAGDTKNTVYYTKDIELATAIDKPSDRCCGLKVGEGNIIERVYDLEAVFGHTYFCRGYFIMDATGSVATFLSPGGSGYTKNGVVAAGGKVWNVSTIGEYGAETTLQYGDCVYAGKTPIGEVAYAYVTSRALENGESKFYWRIDDRMYDSTNKVTTREPDADGYYTYLFAHEGEQVTLRTNNKDFATALDYQSSAPAFALEVKGDIITAVHDGTYAYGGSRYNGWTVLAVNGNELSVVSSSGSEGTWIYDEDCKIFNVSNSYSSHKGERVYSIKVGDVLANYRDINGNPKVLVVKTRETNKMAWPVDPQYDSTNACTTRTPDKNGWYYIDLAVDGKIRTYKSKNKTVISAADSYTSPFGIEVSGDEILYISTTTYVENVKGSGVTGYTVTSASGSSVNTIYTLGHSEKTGTTETLALSADAVIYDVSADAMAAGKFGQAVKLKKGDVIRTFKDNDGNHLYIYVIAHGTRELKAYCSHCDQMVYWTPYVPSSNVVAFDSHYYLATDLNLTSQLRVYSTARDFETVLDLNGHTANRDGGRAALVRYGDTLTIIDSVGGGKLTSKNNTSGGGVIMISGSSSTGVGVVNLYAGTLTIQKSDKDELYTSQGGIITNSGGEFNMYGGKVINGIAYGKTSDGAVGGNIRISSGTFNMYDGEISGGTAFGGTYQAQAKDADGNKLFDKDGNPVMETLPATGNGGNIYAYGKSTVVNIYGGTISGGKAARGGNCTFADGTFYIHDGVITNGIADSVYGKSSDGRGGNIFNTGDLYIKGGTISNGTVLSGYNAGGNVMSTGAAKTIYVSDKAVITNGSAKSGNNIYLMYSNLVVSGGTISDGTVTEGSSINTGGTSSGGYSSITVSGGKIDGYISLGGSTTSDENVKYPDYRTALTLTGGTVEKINASKVYEGVINVSGKPVVKLLTIGSNLLKVGKMESGADITIDTIGVFTQKGIANAASYTGYFHSTSEEFLTGVSGNNELKFYHPNAVAGYCEHCDAEVDWMPWNGGAVGNGHYFLEGDVQLTEAVNVSTETVIDLKGYTITAPAVPERTEENKYSEISARAFYVKGSLTIMDTSENETGVVTGGHANRGGNIYVSEGTFILMSGTITGGVADNNLNSFSEKEVEGEMTWVQGTTGGRGGNIFSTGTVVLLGGTVSDGVATIGSGYGGNICSTGLEASIAIGEGAVVTGGNAKSGGNILLMYSNLVMAGGEISNSGNGVAIDMSGTASGGYSSIVIAGGHVEDTVAASNDANTVIVGGTAVIDDLKLGTGVLAEIVDLAEGASIAVRATGVFTLPMDAAKAEAAVVNKYIIAYNSNMEKIAVNANNELFVTSKYETQYETFYCEHCGQNVEFSSWHGTSIAESGHYYLTEDMTLTDVVSVAKDVDAVINLNGYTVTAASGLKAFNVSGNLSIMDSSDAKTGTVTGGTAYRGGNIYVNDKANFTLYSGSILNGFSDGTLPGGTTGGRGGNIFGNGGTVTLKGGVVSGGVASSGSAWGGNIFMTGGTLTVEEGAVISGGNASTGGNVYLMYAAMVMTGGEIKEGTANTGNGVYLRDSGGNFSSLTMSGGIIDGKVFNYDAESVVSVSGTAQIADLSIKGLLVVGEMTTGASIKVNATSGAFTDVLTNANDVVSYFDAVDAAYNVAVSADGKLEVVADPSFAPENPTKEAYCPHCETMVEWTAWDGTAATGHFYLAAPMTYESAVNISSSKDFVLDLNGQSITPNGCRAFYVSGGATLSIVDTVGTGAITGGNSNGGRGGNIYATGANVKLYGGTISGGTASATDLNQTGNDVAVYNGELVINGVTIGQTYDAGYAVYAFNATAVELTKGSVTGGIFLRGSSTALGAEFTVDTIILRDSNLAAVEERNSSEQITIKITNGDGADLKGEFTSALDNAATAATYFKAVNAENTVVVNAANKLEIVEDTTGGNPGGEPGGDIDTPETSLCPHCELEVEWTPWNGETTSGHYYLTEDVSLTAEIDLDASDAAIDMVIDLRGFDITGDGVAHIFDIRDGAILSICDTVGGGVISGANNDAGNGGNVYVYNLEATFNLYGGTVTGGHANARGGNIYASSANVNLYGGTVTGGTINDTDQMGANIFIMQGDLTISGDAKAIGGADGDGEAVYVRGYTTPSTFVMTGGEIVGELVLRQNIAAAEISGAAKIDEVTLKNDALVTKLGAFEDGASVTFTATEGVVTAALDNAADVLAYVSTVDASKILVANTDSALEVVEACICGCGAPASQTTWIDANQYFATRAEGYAEMPSETEDEKAAKNARRQINGENIHLKLSADLDLTALYGAKVQIQLGNTEAGTVAIDLNGFTWSSEHRFYIYPGSELTVIDTSAEGTGVMMSTGYNASNAGGLFFNQGTLNIYSGTFTQPEGDYRASKGGVVYQSNGEVNFYGGTIIGGQAIENGTASGLGGNVYVHSGTFNMYGGTITGGVANGDASQGGNVYLRSHASVVFNMYGGTISEGTANEGADVYTGENATFNNEGGTVGTPVALCPCGCGAEANAVTWIDANQYFAELGNGYTELTDAAVKKTKRQITGDLHLKLSDNLDIAALYGTAMQIEIGIDSTTTGKVALDLNGYTWTSVGQRAFYVAKESESQLTVLDTSAAGTGKITATGKAGVQGRVIANYGTFNLYSGTLEMLAADPEIAVNGGGVIYQSMGEFNMYGGTITGGKIAATATKVATGGNVYIYRGTFNMYDGTISNGTATAYDDGVVTQEAYGSNICYRSVVTLNLAGGTVEGGESTIEVLPE